MDDDKDNFDPYPDLVCPIPHILMSDDPVLAAGSYTYERAAIEAWFEKQNSEILEAQQDFSAS